MLLRPGLGEARRVPPIPVEPWPGGGAEPETPKWGLQTDSKQVGSDSCHWLSPVWNPGCSSQTVNCGLYEALVASVPDGTAWYLKLTCPD